MGEPSARLFFALWPEPAMQAALADAVAAIVREAGGKPVPASNLHLTLAFLGTVPESRFEALSLAATECAQGLHLRDLPIAVVLDSVEHWRKSEILCATSQETPPAAIELAEALKRSLIAHGFAPDLKPFRVHATLARKVRRLTRELSIEPLQWIFRDFHLVQSQTGPVNGEPSALHTSIYSTLEKWALDKRDR